MNTYFSKVAVVCVVAALSVACGKKAPEASVDTKPAEAQETPDKASKGDSAKEDLTEARAVWGAWPSEPDAAAQTYKVAVARAKATGKPQWAVLKKLKGKVYFDKDGKEIFDPIGISPDDLKAQVDKGKDKDEDKAAAEADPTAAEDEGGKPDHVREAEEKDAYDAAVAKAKATGEPQEVTREGIKGEVSIDEDGDVLFMPYENALADPDTWGKSMEEIEAMEAGEGGQVGQIGEAVAVEHPLPALDAKPTEGSSASQETLKDAWGAYDEGEWGLAEELFARSVHQWPKSSEGRYGFVLAAAKGTPDNPAVAISALETLEALSNSNSNAGALLFGASSDKRLSAIHGHPRFKALVARLNEDSDSPAAVDDSPATVEDVANVLEDIVFMKRDPDALDPFLNPSGMVSVVSECVNCDDSGKSRTPMRSKAFKQLFIDVRKSTGDASYGGFGKRFVSDRCVGGLRKRDLSIHMEYLQRVCVKLDDGKPIITSVSFIQELQ